MDRCLTLCMSTIEILGYVFAVSFVLGVLYVVILMLMGKSSFGDFI